MEERMVELFTVRLPQGQRDGDVGRAGSWLQCGEPWHDHR
ncbi:hypothetical protein ATKI12_5648 [Kitasatospora sp. Ki12]